MLVTNPGDEGAGREGSATLAPHAGSTQGVTVDADVKGGKDLDGRQKLHVLYGSNTGTCEGLAQRIASEASGKGTGLHSFTDDRSIT